MMGWPGLGVEHIVGVMSGRGGSGKRTMFSEVGRGEVAGMASVASGKMVVAAAILTKAWLVADGSGRLSLVCKTTYLLWIFICLVLILAWMSLSS